MCKQLTCMKAKQTCCEKGDVGDWPSDTGTPVCPDNWGESKCLEWSFSRTEGQVVQIFSVLSSV